MQDPVRGVVEGVAFSGSLLAMSLSPLAMAGPAPRSFVMSWWVWETGLHRQVGV